ncbi:MAG: patatin-like phospholipase family protein [Pseudacidovorax sp.]|uniref:patatin-like phospholipase family protein n=1 Tax=Pseudacidovorax sp. TaxID=1934311 RepID=UPI001B4F852D|nr:patatin-like phospholipase family protein [Pseudacidovorax sp.]MBP6897343.1 patatin-like phospholipase family protein [Pseudacidovorax sp.]
MPRRPRIGLALGSGSARGWSHIGVIRTLEEAGYAPDVVCGTSIGALVGAIYAAGRLDWLEDWVRKLTWSGTVAMLDLKMGGGLIEGGKLLKFFREHSQDPDFADLPKAFGCVATELATGREVWLREGPVIDAVRASMALPGLFTPTQQEDRLLVDGGLVNPIPVSLCRAMGADLVIAVDLNWDLIGRRNRTASTDGMAVAELPKAGVLATVLGKLRPAPRAPAGGGTEMPSLLDVLGTSLNIMQVRITQSRMAGEPADVMVRPRLSDIAAMDFHRAAAAIAEGERAARQVLPLLADLAVPLKDGGSLPPVTVQG